MPKDPTLTAVYERAIADRDVGEDPRLVNWMTNSWLCTYATIRKLDELDRATDRLRRTGILSNLAAGR